MKKLLFTICLLLAGCNRNTEINFKEFKVSGEKVLVGGSMLGGDVTADFKPEVTLEKWGGETYLKVWSEETGDKTASQVGDKVVWNSTSGNEYNFYTKTAQELGTEEGGFEYEIIFKEKPLNNIVTLKIETQDLDFFYQPELTQEEIDEGSFRPENVIGSYAVYHKNKSGDYSKMGGQNYKVGKAFHIYRPQIIDAKGEKIWATMNIDKMASTLIITIDQKFLDNATYPVIVDPTIGYTSAGATENQWTANNMRGIGEYTVGAGTVDKISYYVRGSASNIKAVMVSSSTLTILANGVGNTVAPDSVGWYDATFTNKPSLDALTGYVACGVSDSGNNYGYYDTIAARPRLLDTTNSYASPTDPTDATWGASTIIRSIYATYTETPAATAAKPITSDWSSLE